MTLNLRALTGAAALASVVLVSGCGSDGISVKTDDGTVRIDREDEGGVSIETEDGSATVGTDLAEDFPSDEVPLIEGTVISSASMASESTPGFSAVIETDAALNDARDAADKLLVDAGYKRVTEMSTSGNSFRGYQNSTWTLTVQVFETDGRSTVAYTVGRVS